MVNPQLVLVLSIVASIAAATIDQAAIAPRVINGMPIDTLRRFPHHVKIIPIRENYSDSESTYPFCGGSILNDLWILTSARCVDYSVQLELQFERLYVNNSEGSYSAKVGSKAIHIYPTYYDDIALVRLPFRLIFSDTIRPISITTQPLSLLQGKLAVLAGFDDKLKDAPSPPLQAQQLSYVMLNVTSNDECKNYYGSWIFDEYLQLCTKTWGTWMPSGPCFNDYGSGLVAGWPARSELIGIYTGTGHDCTTYSPAVYTNVAKYVTWIESLINY